MATSCCLKRCSINSTVSKSTWFVGSSSRMRSLDGILLLRKNKVEGWELRKKMNFIYIYIYIIRKGENSSLIPINYGWEFTSSIFPSLIPIKSPSTMIHCATTCGFTSHLVTKWVSSKPETGNYFGPCPLPVRVPKDGFHGSSLLNQTMIIWRLLRALGRTQAIIV